MTRNSLIRHKTKQSKEIWEGPCGALAKQLNFKLEVTELEPHALYHFFFRTWETFEIPFSSSHGLNNITAVLLQRRFWYSIRHWYGIKQRNQTKQGKCKKTLDIWRPGHLWEKCLRLFFDIVTQTNFKTTCL